MLKLILITAFNCMKILSKLQMVFLVLSGFFIWRFMVKNLDKLNLSGFVLDPISLVLASVFSLFSFFFLANKLSALYEAEIPELRLGPVFKTVAKTNLFRYLPGGIWNHTGLAIEASVSSGKSLKTTSKLQVLNILFMVYTGALFLFFVLPSPLNWLLIMAFLLSMLLINQGFKLINQIWQKFGFKQKLHLVELAPQLLSNILLNNFLFWLFNGLSFVYFLQGLGVIKAIDLPNLIYLSSSYILAWLAGFLFLPAPAGVGVREAVLGYFFSSYGFSLALGVSVSLLYRLFILGRDLLVYAVSLFVQD